MKKIMTGSEAIARAAVSSGVKVVTGYPGAPISEIMKVISKNTAEDDVFLEWSTNEKVALEVAIGASASGARSMCIMKHIGLNVASDPLNVANITGIVGGLLILVGSDPIPSSSQNSMDPRHYAHLANIPYFEAAGPDEASRLVRYLLRFSEEQKVPVILGVTSKVTHAMEQVELFDEKDDGNTFRFDRNGHQFVCLPFTVKEKVPALNHKMRNIARSIVSPFEGFEGEGKTTVIAVGFAYNPVKEAMEKYGFSARVLKISRVHPLPEQLIEQALESSDRILVVEERDPIVEKEILVLASKIGSSTPVFGTLTKHIPREGALSTYKIGLALSKIFEKEIPEPKKKIELIPRAGTLCAGCPHRSSYYLIRKALAKYEDAVIVGDRGCYNRAAAPPMNLLDVCMNMGSGVGIAEGISKVSPDQKVVAVMGDSTFFHSGLASVMNAAAGFADITVFILDNSCTAMTGQQPNPGTGETVRGEPLPRVDIYDLLKSRGHARVHQVDPYDVTTALPLVEKAIKEPGLSIVIMRRACVLKSKPQKVAKTLVDADKCVGCRTCIRETGCPALVYENGKVRIDQTKCVSCGLCKQTCPVNAIGEKYGV